MTNEFVLEAITREFPESVLHVSEPYGMLTLEIKKEDLKKVVHHLRDSSLEINFLTDVCGIHYPQDPEKELGGDLPPAQHEGEFQDPPKVLHQEGRCGI